MSIAVSPPQQLIRGYFNIIIHKTVVFHLWTRARQKVLGTEGLQMPLLLPRDGVIREPDLCSGSVSSLETSINYWEPTVCVVLGVLMLSVPNSTPNPELVTTSGWKAEAAKTVTVSPLVRLTESDWSHDLQGWTLLEEEHVWDEYNKQNTSRDQG